jgi:hypothetical protein
MEDISRLEWMGQSDMLAQLLSERKKGNIAAPF